MAELHPEWTDDATERHDAIMEGLMEMFYTLLTFGICVVPLIIW